VEVVVLRGGDLVEVVVGDSVVVHGVVMVWMGSGGWMMDDFSFSGHFCERVCFR
jgi:hypothetical protein